MGGLLEYFSRLNLIVAAACAAQRESWLWPFEIICSQPASYDLAAFPRL